MHPLHLINISGGSCCNDFIKNLKNVWFYKRFEDILNEETITLILFLC